MAEYMPNDTLAKHLFHCKFVLDIAAILHLLFGYSDVFNLEIAFNRCTLCSIMIVFEKSCLFMG